MIGLFVIGGEVWAMSSMICEKENNFNTKSAFFFSLLFSCTRIKNMIFFLFLFRSIKNRNQEKKEKEKKNGK